MSPPISAFGLHVWDSLHQTAPVDITPNTTAKELDRIMQKRYERGWYINWLSHQGPGGAIACCMYVDSLAGN